MPTSSSGVAPTGLTSRIPTNVPTSWSLLSATADRRGEDLAYFAQRLALRTASDLAVMGHTHGAISGLGISPVNYVNNGYECVARPDAPDRAVAKTQAQFDAAVARYNKARAEAGGKAPKGC